jgi:two-component system nitrogen regulation response regulator GlnG
VLAEGEFFRVGGQEAIHVDVRIIAATNQNLEKAVEQGRFRDDLYHRLNVLRINTPPLRERREDIPDLLNYYLARASDELGIERKTLTPEALAVFRDFAWPGNVRQLVNATRRVMVSAPGNEIRSADIPLEFSGSVGDGTHLTSWTVALADWARQYLVAQPDKPLLLTAQADFERVLITTALELAGGRKQDAAKLLGWGRNTLARKIRELNIDA